MATVGARAAHLIREGRWGLPAICLQHILNWREERSQARYGDIGLQLAPYFCREDKDAVDVGARDGCYVHVLREYARRVYAFEPVPWRAQALKTKFLRDIERQKVLVKPVALSASRGVRAVRVPSGTMQPPAKDVLVRAEALDHFHLHDVGFIKLDAAGGEEHVLAGASRTIIGCQPRVQVDIDESDAPGMAGRLAGWFRRLEYRGYFIQGRAVLMIDRFLASAMQSRPDDREPSADADGAVRSNRKAAHFFFLPPGEPEGTLQRVAAHLARP